MKQVSLSVLGSTGSIGEQTLEIVNVNPERFKISCLASGRNWQRLAEQTLQFKPELVAIYDLEAARNLEREVGHITKVVSGEEGILAAAVFAESEVVIAAILGFAGLRSVIEAINAGKLIALANKESLIAGGTLLQQILNNSKAKIIPVDSEHNSIFQCLYQKGVNRSVEKAYLTASGGPFLRRPLETFDKITPSEAVKHPRWSMGAKISVDSATLVNKGLEVIEAAYLFDLSADQIGIVVHPESVIHGLVDFSDGATHAILYPPDMKVPIFHAIESLLSDKEQSPTNSCVKKLNLPELGSLNFLKVEPERFPAITDCYQALKLGKSAPIVLNAANEVAVEKFLIGKCRFTQIAEVISAALAESKLKDITSFNDVIDANNAARVFAEKWVEKYGRTPESNG